MSKKSVLNKIIPIGTLQKRQQQKKEVEEMKNESKNAIDRNFQNLNLDPEYYQTIDQEISAIGPGEKKKLEPLLQVLIEWINNELAENCIIVKDIQEDLFDGHILQLLIEKLFCMKISESKLKLSEISQKQNLELILDFVNTNLNLDPSKTKWNVEKIYGKDLISILHLLVALVKHLDIGIKLPDNVSVNVIIVSLKNKIPVKKTIVEQITASDQHELKRERDAFDALFDNAPDKLELVKNALIQFLRKHLNKIDTQIDDLETQLNDGVLLIRLMGVLENYFVPDYSYHRNPVTLEQKIENNSFLFELIEEAGLSPPTCRPQDITNEKNSIAITRILYSLFAKYKDLD